MNKMIFALCVLVFLSATSIASVEKNVESVHNSEYAKNSNEIVIDENSSEFMKENFPSVAILNHDIDLQFISHMPE